jgi:hypothetical protein
MEILRKLYMTSIMLFMSLFMFMPQTVKASHHPHPHPDYYISPPAQTVLIEINPDDTSQYGKEFPVTLHIYDKKRLNDGIYSLPNPGPFIPCTPEDYDGNGEDDEGCYILDNHFIEDFVTSHIYDFQQQDEFFGRITNDEFFIYLTTDSELATPENSPWTFKDIIIKTATSNDDFETIQYTTHTDYEVSDYKISVKNFKKLSEEQAVEIYITYSKSPSFHNSGESQVPETPQDQQPPSYPSAIFCNEGTPPEIIAPDLKFKLLSQQDIENVKSYTDDYEHLSTAYGDVDLLYPTDYPENLPQQDWQYISQFQEENGDINLTLLSGVRYTLYLRGENINENLKFVLEPKFNQKNRVKNTTIHHSPDKNYDAEFNFYQRKFEESGATEEILSNTDLIAFEPAEISFITIQTEPSFVDTGYLSVQKETTEQTNETFKYNLKLIDFTGRDYSNLDFTHYESEINPDDKLDDLIPLTPKEGDIIINLEDVFKDNLFTGDLPKIYDTTFEIKSGQTLFLDNLPVDVFYYIEELHTPGWKLKEANFEFPLKNNPNAIFGVIGDCEQRAYNRFMELLNENNMKNYILPGLLIHGYCPPPQSSSDAIYSGMYFENFIFINEPSDVEPTRTLLYHKFWKEVEYKEHFPEELEGHIKVLKDGVDITEEVSDNITIRKELNDLVIEVTDLPVYNDDGFKAFYTIREEGLENFHPFYEDADNLYNPFSAKEVFFTGSITNQELVDIKIKKETSHHTNDEFNFRISAYVPMFKYNSDTHEFNSTTVWYDLSSQLGNPTTQDGNVYEFTLKENEEIDLKIPVGYTYKISELPDEMNVWNLVSIDTAGGTSINDYFNDDNKITSDSVSSSNYNQYFDSEKEYAYFDGTTRAEEAISEEMVDDKRIVTFFDIAGKKFQPVKDMEQFFPPVVCPPGMEKCEFKDGYNGVITFFNARENILTIKKKVQNPKSGNLDEKYRFVVDSKKCYPEEGAPDVPNCDSEVYNLYNDGYIEYDTTKGEYYFYLSDGEELSFPIDSSTSLIIREDSSKDYTFSINNDPDAEKAVIENPNSDENLLFTNYLTSSLSVSKKTVDNVKGSFDFKIKICKDLDETTFPPTIPGEPASKLPVGCIIPEQSQTAEELETIMSKIDEDGYYQFTLQENETKTFNYIPYGYKYEVKELSQDGWRVIGQDKYIGEVKKDESIEFLNEKYFTLKFYKTAFGSSEFLDEEFEFTVSAKTSRDEVIDLSDQGGILVEDGIYKFILKSSQSKEFELPAGSKYSIIEKISDRFLTYTSLSNSNEVSGTLGSNTEINFTNIEKHPLEFSKKVSGNQGDKKKEFEFVVKLYTNTLNDETYENNYENDVIDEGNFYTAKLTSVLPSNHDNEPFISINSGHDQSPVYFDLSEYGGTSNGDGTYTFKLKHGDNITIPDIPYGYSYEIVEKDYSEEEYLTTVDGVEGRVASGNLTTNTLHKFENNKNTPVDTGLFLSTGSMVVILAAAVIFVGKKRTATE